jgi:hypothetical protein
MKLHRSLYGLITSAKTWYDTMNQQLVSMGFTSNESAPCLYVHPDGSIVLLYVYDLLINGCDDDRTDEIYDILSRKFSMKNLGDVSLYLGIQIQVNSETGITTINQHQYEDDLFSKYLSNTANGIAMPAEK